MRRGCARATRCTSRPTCPTATAAARVPRRCAASATPPCTVERDGGANEVLQRVLVDLLALVEVDGAPDVPVEAGVEEARGILQRGPFGEGHLHDALVRLARADDPVVLPRRDPSPLPLLDDVGIGLLDQATEPAEHLAAPVAELRDALVDELRRRLVGHRADATAARTAARRAAGTRRA